jgi:hypothetical protein
LSEKRRKALIKHFGLSSDATTEEILKAFFENHAIELRTVHDTVRCKKRKLTKKEMEKYAAWAELAGVPKERIVREDILKRWGQSWFTQIVPKLEEYGFNIWTSRLKYIDLFGTAFKEETGAFSIDADWLDEDMIVKLAYRSVLVLVSRSPNDDLVYYSKNGDMLVNKWDIRYALEEFERPLMEKAGYKLADNRCDWEYWFHFDTKSPARAVRAIKSLKRVHAKIKKHFNAIYESVELADKASNIMDKAPESALKLAEKALKLNPRNKEAKSLVKELK